MSTATDATTPIQTNIPPFFLPEIPPDSWYKVSPDIPNLLYCKKRREYLVTNFHGEEVGSCPAGQKGVAQKLALKTLDPEAYRQALTIIRKYPPAESRVWRALILCGRGVVSAEPHIPNEKWAIQGHVHGSDGFKYDVKIGKDISFCDCPDTEAPYTEKGSQLCKHVLAVHFRHKSEIRIAQMDTHNIHSLLASKWSLSVEA